MYDRREAAVISDPRKPEAVQLGERMQAWLRERDAYAPEVCDADMQGFSTFVRIARTPASMGTARQEIYSSRAAGGNCSQ